MYLSIDQRRKLIKQIQQGDVIIKDQEGKIEKKTDRLLYSKPDCEIFDVIKILSDVEQIGKGSYGTAYKVCMPKCDNSLKSKNKISYAIKRVKFKDHATYNTSVKNPDRYENVEIRMLQYLSKLVLTKTTPHINLPIMTWVCESKNSVDPTYRYIASELADHGDLFTFLSKKCKKPRKAGFWKTIFFQILSTLAVIQDRYPNFKHNDLKPDNILVRNSSKSRGVFQYKIGGTTYYIPNIGGQICIWDFDFSSIAGVIDNDKVILFTNEDNSNITMHKNRYYDVAMCFGYIHRLFGDCMEEEVVDWLNDVLLPGNIPTARDYRILEDIEKITPLKLIETPFFKNFTVKRKNLQVLDEYSIDNSKKADFIFSKNFEHRYKSPSTCEYHNFIYLTPKNLTKKEKENLKYRLKCRTADTSDDRILKLASSQYNRIKNWMSNCLSKAVKDKAISSNEKTQILDFAIIHFRMFIEKYFVTKKSLYVVAMCSVMYASYRVVLAYISPLNEWRWWLDQPKLDGNNIYFLIDIFKQYCNFVSKYIEKNFD